MGPFQHDEPEVFQILNEWFAQTNEIFAESYLPRSGASGDFFLLRSVEEYRIWMQNTRSGSFGFLLKTPQLPLRGVVDEAFICEARRLVDDATWFVGIEPPRFPEDLNFLASGRGHADLHQELTPLRGQNLWFGADFVMPDNSLKTNTSPDELVVLKR